MEIEISDETMELINQVEKILGIRKKELVNRAILVYVDGMSKQIALKNEFGVWDELSDESLDNFEKSL